MNRARRPGSLAAPRIVALALACAVASPAAAADGALTPTGAEQAASADGTIPAWEGGLDRPPAGWSAEQGYVDPFADESPRVVIDAANMDAHRPLLAPGLQALLRTRSGFRVPVYPSHRSFAGPPEVIAATLAAEGRARVEERRLVGHRPPGLPFRQPASGEEAMFNHLHGWIGAVSGCSDWFPIRPSGTHYRVGWCSTIVEGHRMEGADETREFAYFLGWYDAPASLVGTIYLVHEPTDRAADGRRAWIYNAGQRRVRRAPDLAFDNVADGTDGMATIDDAAGFNGSLERYRWTLLGKQALLVPYNAYRLGDPALRYERMIRGNDIDAALMRYEVHRVWVVEATLAEGMSHIYARRRFYLDEDSWQIVMAENYDGRGALWRVILRPLIQLYDVPTMIARAQLNYDLLDGSLLLSGLDNERRPPAMQWNIEGRLADFQPAALRRK